MEKRKFWKGRKRLAKKYYPKWLWNYFTKNGLPEVGDITHDCDGMNHVISEITWVPWPLWRKAGVRGSQRINRQPHSITIWKPEATFWQPPGTHGNKEGWHQPVCGCTMVEFQPPESQENIHKWILSWDNEEARAEAQRWNFTTLLAQLEALKAGRSVVDERGILLPEWIPTPSSEETPNA